jgi:hypothetical protein
VCLPFANTLTLCAKKGEDIGINGHNGLLYIWQKDGLMEGKEVGARGGVGGGEPQAASLSGKNYPERESEIC